MNADVHVRIHLLTTGRFLTILPESLVQFAAKRWAIKALPIDLGVQALGIVTLRNRTLVQFFIECAREVAKSIAGRSRTN